MNAEGSLLRAARAARLFVVMTDLQTQINPRSYGTLVGIDDEVLKALTERAVPFIDDPNAVLRRLLELDVATGQTNGRPSPARPLRLTRSPAAPARGRVMPSKSSKPPRAPKGSLTPEEAFEVPILEVLSVASNGERPSRDVVREVGARMDARLNEHDRFEDDKGVARWEKRVPFVRMRLVERGLLSKDAPRGSWKITDAGREWLASR